MHRPDVVQSMALIGEQTLVECNASAKNEPAEFCIQQAQQLADGRITKH